MTLLYSYSLDIRNYYGLGIHLDVTSDFEGIIYIYFPCLHWQPRYQASNALSANTRSAWAANDCLRLLIIDAEPLEYNVLKNHVIVSESTDLNLINVFLLESQVFVVV